MNLINKIFKFIKFAQKMTYHNALEILGVSNNITQEELDKKRRALTKLHHPDLGGSPEKMALINAAYDEVKKVINSGFRPVDKTNYKEPAKPAPKKQPTPITQKEPSSSEKHKTKRALNTLFDSKILKNIIEIFKVIKLYYEESDEIKYFIDKYISRSDNRAINKFIINTNDFFAELNYLNDDDLENSLAKAVINTNLTLKQEKLMKFFLIKFSSIYDNLEFNMFYYSFIAYEDKVDDETIIIALKEYKKLLPIFESEYNVFLNALKNIKDK